MRKTGWEKQGTDGSLQFKDATILWFLYITNIENSYLEPPTQGRTSGALAPVMSGRTEIQKKFTSA